jgi:exodeoxyribonuclease-3
MKIIAWNINGMRSMINNNFNELNLLKLLKDEDPDIICFGETKLSNVASPIHTELDLYKYKYISNSIVKKGYSGTAIFSKKKPIDVKYGLLKNEFIEEGRVITLEFSKYYLVHCYTPNSGEVLARLQYRVNTWDQEFKKYLIHLQKIKPIIVCGDLNVANNEIDLHDPVHNKKSAGFTIEERNSFKSILADLNLTDCYRYFYPNKIEYSYWSYRRNARGNNKGWRIDYFLVSDKLLKKIKSSNILTHIMGSDHAPIILLLK